MCRKAVAQGQAVVPAPPVAITLQRRPRGTVSICQRHLLPHLMRPRYPFHYQEAADGWQGVQGPHPGCRLPVRCGCQSHQSCGLGGVSPALGGLLPRGLGGACWEVPASRYGSPRIGGSVPPWQPELRPLLPPRAGGRSGNIRDAALRLLPRSPLAAARHRWGTGSV